MLSQAELDAMRKIAEAGIREAEFEIQRQREKRAFHKGQISVIARIEARSGAPASRKEPARRRRYSPKIKANNKKQELREWLRNNGGLPLQFAEVAAAYQGNESTLHTYLCEFARAGLIVYKDGVVFSVQR